MPSLDDAKNGKTMTVREQMELHRNNPVCASCHTKMDPLGFSLENYDAVGEWRTGYAGQLVDASAVLPDGTKFDGPASGLQGILLSPQGPVRRSPDRAADDLCAGARGLESYDMPAVRNVRYQAAKDDYRMQTIILGIVQSVPFTMRRTPRNMMITRKPMGRRTLLRGMGTVMALPLLEAMMLQRQGGRGSGRRRASACRSSTRPTA